MPTVFTKNNCHQCTITKMKMKSQGVEFIERNVEEDEEALATVKAMGYMQMPVVYVDENNHWSGMRPDKLMQFD